MKWVGHVAFIGGVERCIQGLVVIVEGKIPPGRSRRRWEDNTY
jgi:hypothetical protein